MSKHPRFFPIVQHAAQDPKLTRNDLVVLGYLTSWWWGTGEAFPAIITIATECGISRSSAKRALLRLRSLKYVTIVYIKDPDTGLNLTNHYLPGRSFTHSRMGPQLNPRSRAEPLLDKTNSGYEEDDSKSRTRGLEWWFDEDSGKWLQKPKE